MVNVMEIIGPTPQGEGLYSGRLSIFVRTALCNFSCGGFGVKYNDTKTGEEKLGCDSFYAVDKSYKDTWCSYTSFEEFVDAIDNNIPKYSKHNIIKPDIVFTGGEPIIYWKDDVYQRTIQHYLSQGHNVTIETNASLDIEFTRKYQEQITFSMSVKLDNSGEPSHKRVNIDTITKMAEMGNNSYLKFVVSKDTWDKDWSEIKNILKSIPYFVPVYLMPLGGNKEKLESNARFTAEKCTELGFHYSDRTHIRIWNDEAGH